MHKLNITECAMTKVLTKQIDNLYVMTNDDISKYDTIIVINETLKKSARARVTDITYLNRGCNMNININDVVEIDYIRDMEK